MYTIVGLGNPDSEHTKTRHNAGRIVVSMLAKEHDVELKEQKKPDVLVGTGDVKGERVRVVLPNTYMNKSGAAVSKYIKGVSAAKKLMVVYDDVDLPFGKVRVSFGSSSGGHNGIKSIERAIKTKDFIKIRIGVAKQGKKKGTVVAKKPVGEVEVVKYLMGNFTKGELEKVEAQIYERVVLALDTIIETGDPVMGMNAVNGLSPIN